MKAYMALIFSMLILLAWGIIRADNVPRKRYGKKHKVPWKYNK